MRPLHLTISGFCSYAGMQELDMDKLGDNGLYLITGDTGAGKTTIFDAICFALYGMSSGASREAKMLRSTYADPETETFVELVFSHRGKKYRIRRNPDYERPKKRGTGITRECANAELYLPDGVVVSDKRKVDNAIHELLGVDKDQFTQISMIVQGDFLKLLTADSSDRQKIFSRLFGTTKYWTLMKRLADEDRKMSMELDDIKKSIDQYISGIACDVDDVLWIEAEKAKTGQLPMDDTMILIDKIITQDKRKSSLIETETEITDKKLGELDIQIGKAQQLGKAKNQLKEAEVKLEMVQSQIPAAQIQLDNAREAFSEAGTLQNKAAAIGAELPGYDRLEELRCSVEEKKHLMEQNTEQKKEIQHQIKIRQEDIIKLKEEREALAGAGEKRAELVSECRNLSGRADDLKDLQNRLSDMAEKKRQAEMAQAKYISDRDEYNKKRDVYERMDQAYRDGQAGILAQGLKDGDACPVCGSATHPRLAALADMVPGKDELDSAKHCSEDARNRAERSSRNANASLSMAAAVWDNIVVQADKILAGDGVLKELHTESNRCKENAGMMPEMGRLPDVLNQRLDEVRAKLEDYKEKIETENRNVTRRDKLDKEIPRAEESLDNLKARYADLEKSIVTLTATIESDAKQQVEIKAGLSFESRNEAQRHRSIYLKQADQIQKKYDEAQKKYNVLMENVKTCEGQIDGLQRSISDTENIDLGRLETEKEFVKASQKRLRMELQRLHSRIETNENVKKKICGKADSMVFKEKQAALVSALSDTASGNVKGKNKINLETYIQMTYFDRIIRRANARFMKMSDGQYELKRVTNSSNMRSQIGLDLCIVDHYNGSERSVKSLSGGESFMASLSLALGLSDEVQAFAGGIQIDTMFVDEGFGSLDTDKTLPQAYNALISITEGRKLVGIISHVTELKEKIDKQIVVTKDRSGCSEAKILY